MSSVAKNKSIKFAKFDTVYPVCSTGVYQFTVTLCSTRLEALASAQCLPAEIITARLTARPRKNQPISQRRFFIEQYAAILLTIHHQAEAVHLEYEQLLVFGFARQHLLQGPNVYQTHSSIKI